MELPGISAGSSFLPTTDQASLKVCWQWGGNWQRLPAFCLRSNSVAGTGGAFSWQLAVTWLVNKVFLVASSLRAGAAFRLIAAVVIQRLRSLYLVVNATALRLRNPSAV